MTYRTLQTCRSGSLARAQQAVALSSVLDNLFNDTWSSLANPAVDWDAAYPPVDIFERDQELVVRVELAGAKKEDLVVSVENGVLTVSGERKHEARHADASVCRCESVAGRFSRSFTLPYKVDETKTKAAYVDGVLTVTLPKAEEAKPRQIAINIQ